jgi:hypothetical protein
MLKNNIYNIDKEFDYSKIKSIVVKSLETIVQQEALNIPNIINDVVADSGGNGDPNNAKPSAPPSPLLKLKIRNTT